MPSTFGDGAIEREKRARARVGVNFAPWMALAAVSSIVAVGVWYAVAERPVVYVLGPSDALESVTRTDRPGEVKDRNRLTPGNYKVTVAHTKVDGSIERKTFENEEVPRWKPPFVQHSIRVQTRTHLEQMDELIRERLAIGSSGSPSPR